MFVVFVLVLIVVVLGRLGIVNAEPCTPSPFPGQCENAADPHDFVNDPLAAAPTPAPKRVLDMSAPEPKTTTNGGVVRPSRQPMLVKA